MNYDEEIWVKVYTRDTASWMALSWQARGLSLEIARKLPKATGELSLGRKGLSAIAPLVRATWEEIEPFVMELIDDGRLVYDAVRQVITDPQHVERQSAMTAGAERTRRWRTSQAASVETPTSPTSPNVTDVTDVTDRHTVTSPNVTDVTDRHTVTSPNVTNRHPRHCVTSRSDEEKRREEKRTEEIQYMSSSASPPSEVWGHYLSKLKRVRPKRRPGAMPGGDRKRVTELVKSGYSVEDLKSAIDGLLRSPHHLGQNDRDTEYLELEYALRKPDQMIALADEGAPLPDSQASMPTELVDPATIEAFVHEHPNLQGVL